MDVSNQSVNMDSSVEDYPENSFSELYSNTNSASNINNFKSDSSNLVDDKPLITAEAIQDVSYVENYLPPEVGNIGAGINVQNNSDVSDNGTQDVAVEDFKSVEGLSAINECKDEASLQKENEFSSVSCEILNAETGNMESNVQSCENNDQSANDLILQSEACEYDNDIGSATNNQTLESTEDDGAMHTAQIENSELEVENVADNTGPPELTVGDTESQELVPEYVKSEDPAGNIELQEPEQSEISNNSTSAFGGTSETLEDLTENVHETENTFEGTDGGAVTVAEPIQVIINNTEILTVEEISMDDGSAEALNIEPVVIEPAAEDVNDSVENFVEGEFTVIEHVEESESTEIIIMESDGVAVDDQEAATETVEVAELPEQEKAEVEIKTDTPIKMDVINPILKNLKIPQHVLGRNMEKPVEDKFSNGRVPPKPRLGVKIPYRNLTSQIVSKQEIENVIMERARAKNASNEPPAGGDLLFTKKLTQRLAKKIAPAGGSPKEGHVRDKKDVIADNSDLIAILEGDGEEWDVPHTSKSTKRAEPVEDELKQREKEIALRQLEQLPNRRKGRPPADSTILRRIDSSLPKFEVKSVTKPVSTKSSGKTESSLKGHNLPKSGTPIKINKDAEAKKAELAQKSASDPEVPEKSLNGTGKVEVSAKEDDIEPRFATNTVVKTYTRKRKPSEGVASLAKSSDTENQPKKPLKVSSEHKVSIDLPPTAYITKSSRIIKKKVIWDPDEAASPIKKNKFHKLDDKVKIEKSEKYGSIHKEKRIQKSPLEEKKVQKSVTEEKRVQKVVAEVKKVQKASSENESPAKKMEKQVSPRKPKRLTEIDRLLMDEGAINMLYDVKNTEDNIMNKQKKRKLSTISIEKVERELLNKTKEIKNDLQISTNRESPKSLRKKETPPKMIKKDVLHLGSITRQKSKDSNRSSVHSPPASPAFVFPHHADASRIIRRHSSSSFSSFDEEEEEDMEVVRQVSKQEKVAKKKVLQDKGRKFKNVVEKENLTLEEKTKLSEEMSKSFNKLTEHADENKVKDKYFELKTIRVKVHDNLVQVMLNSVKKEALLNVRVLNDLCVLLNQLEVDTECDAVVISSSGNVFCHGLDYKFLVSDNAEIRNKKAKDLAVAVKEFLKCLVRFPKFIGAGVDGSVIDFGVTMLPLFDMVLASDRTTFSVPCAKLGCVAAGSYLLTLPHLSNYAVACELLYMSQKIAADDAASHGLVTRTILPNKFHEQVLAFMKEIAEQSQQSILATKKQLRQRIFGSIEADINAETEVLIKHWTSKECQAKFSTYKVDKE